MTNEHTFPALDVVKVDGEEFYIVQDEVFYRFFNSVMSYTDLNGSEALRKINNDYNNSLKIKRKRIRNKRLKIILNVMYRIMVSFAHKNHNGYKIN